MMLENTRTPIGCFPDIQKGFKKKMKNASIEDTICFINKSKMPEIILTGTSLHFAIVNENDEYLGTVSLKNIDMENKTAEYAITTRKIAQGRGISVAATEKVLKKAFNEIGLHRVYLSVFSTNESAIKFYEKIGFKYEGEFREHFFINGEYVNWKWYGLIKEEYLR